MTTTHAHIIAIRRQGVIDGHQLRINGGGAGQSRYFASGKHGGPDQALAAAQRAALSLNLPATLPRGGAKTGRINRSSVSRAAGIRFEWAQFPSGPVLYVRASWVNRQGHPCSTSFSVERNGLDAALDRALAARTSCGAAMPDRPALLERLRQAYCTRPPAAN